MNDDKFDSILKAHFSTKYTVDEHLKAKVKRKLYEKQERHNNFFLCLIQVAMFVMTFSVVAAVFIINQRTIGIFLMTYFVVGTLISIIVILLYSSKNKIRGRVKSYD